MKKRGIKVNDPNAIVLVDNISNGSLCIPRDGKSDVIIRPKATAQLSWADFVRVKNIPGFGSNIKLNDSVVISDGMVKIRNVAGNLSDDEMTEILARNVDAIKEVILTFNAAELELFKAFLVSRNSIGVEPEKCEELLNFIENFDSTGEQPTNDDDNEARKKTKKQKKATNKTE